MDVPDHLLPIICYAWPDHTVKSRTELLAHWGWQVQTERTPSSWAELWEWLDESTTSDGLSDFWNQGYGRVAGWQFLFSARGNFGGLREITRDFDFPILEWTLMGNAASYDLDIIVRQTFFTAHVVRGKLDQSFEKVEGRAERKDFANVDRLLLSWDFPPGLWPYLSGISRQFEAYGSLAKTLSALGVPAGLWTLSSEAFHPIYLEMKDVPPEEKVLLR